MCGIAGFLHIDGAPASREILRPMADAIAHRGPDGEGFMTDGPVGFAHRRLAILDLSPAGAQPMATEDGTCLLTYNGEVYNFTELRTELEARGCRFRSRTDSEVVLRALALWGEDALLRFNGMFALAFWNRGKRELLLARDRYGTKPLYYGQAGAVLAFGSETKAILKHPSFRVTLDKEAMLEYFTFQNFFTDRTLFAGLRLLPPGCLLRATPGTGQIRVFRYWDYRFEEPQAPRDEREYLEELDRLFQQAVRRQLVSDVEVGSYLSGGMDSGAITAVAAEKLPYLKTFTCGFDMSSASGIELNFDEREKAERLSYLLKTEHYEVVLKSGDMERILPRLTRHLEEPRAGQSYPNFYVAQLAGRFVKVILSGTGGDELFGGYPWRYYRAVVNDDFEHYVDKYYLYWQRLVDNCFLRRMFQPIWSDVSHVWTRDIFRDVFNGHPVTLTRPEDYVNHSLYFEAKTFLHGLLIVEDKLSMAHGLESRVPFLDNDLVDFAMRLPVRLKLARLEEALRINENEPGDKRVEYFKRTRDGKLLLRRMMERYVPVDFTRMEKQGFSAPDASWFRSEGLEYVRRLIFNPKGRLYDYLDPETVQSLVTEHLDGKVNRRLFIWSLLSTEHWLQQFIP